MLNMKSHANDCNNNDYIIGLDFNLKKLLKRDSRMDSDCITTMPIRSAADWGSISAIPGAAAPDIIPLPEGHVVKHPKLINGLADQFIEYYEHHLNKTFIFIQDSEWGNARRPDADLTYNEQFAERLSKARWTVQIVNMGRVPRHQTRYHLAHEFLGEKDKGTKKQRTGWKRCFW
ncbi:hypothetical protein [Pontibacter burrus]|uniref:Uncharacterized protein n=1 Tax=Pontibacter burrus TaxID=2704466 RepID=A0A6B3LUL8_9BACT|nr:hypothetical protein [Pontibacter burrus]NEM97194.1 hypothetical protein [Pontibacter burrus]